MVVKPVAKRIISQDIIEQLVEMIAEGKLNAGDKLPSERELAERLEVSRPSLREAIRVMEIIGLVEIRPGSGTVVTNLNVVPFLKTIYSLFAKQEGIGLEFLQVRAILAEGSASLAAKSDRTDKESTLGPCIRAMKAAADAADTSKLGNCDLEFHKALFGLSGNRVLAIGGEIVDSILEMLVVSKRAYSVSDHQSLFEQHEAVYRAVINGDVEEARESMRRHLRFTESYYTSGKSESVHGRKDSHTE